MYEILFQRHKRGILGHQDYQKVATEKNFQRCAYFLSYKLCSINSSSTLFKSSWKRVRFDRSHLPPTDEQSSDGLQNKHMLFGDTQIRGSQISKATLAPTGSVPFKHTTMNTSTEAYVCIFRCYCCSFLFFPSAQKQAIPNGFQNLNLQSLTLMSSWGSLNIKPYLRQNQMCVRMTGMIEEQTLASLVILYTQKPLVKYIWCFYPALLLMHKKKSFVMFILHNKEINATKR